MGSRKVWLYPSGIAGDIHSGAFVSPPDESFEWWQQTNEPLRVKKPLPVGLYSGFTGDLHTGAFVPPPDESFEWWVQTNEPLRVKKPIPVGLYSGFTGDLNTGAVAPLDISYEWWTNTNVPFFVKKDVVRGTTFEGNLDLGAAVSLRFSKRKMRIIQVGVPLD